MGIPASALKEDELFHYPALEPGAAAELARRIASGDIDPNAGLEDLREDIRMLESQADDSENKLNRLRDGAEDASSYIKRAMKRDEDGWWRHPGIPDFGGEKDPASYIAWADGQNLERKCSHMLDEVDGHLNEFGETHCNDWEPESPGPEWSLMGIFDTEDGPYAT